jgi:NADPH:quinone reductase-like Zn-dependent oxidoreductase
LVISGAGNTLRRTTEDEKGIPVAKAVLFNEIGGPEVLKVADVEVGAPGTGELRIRVDAVGLNRAEAMFRAGVYAYPPNLPGSRIGYEAAGTVDAVGPGVDRFKPGDAVCVIPGFLMTRYGSYGDEILAPASAVVHRPETVDAVAGAAVWMAYTTAYGLLIEAARIRPGDTVLVTAASSSVGLAAIQIANHLGAIPVAATRTAAKKARLEKAGAASVVATDDEDLVAHVRARTGGRGADIAIDAVAGPGVNTIVQAVAPGGTLIVYGFLDPAPVPLPIAPDFRGRNTRTYAFTEVTMDEPVLRRAERFINAGLRSGSFTPVIDRTFDLADVVPAHHYLESNEQVGKIVLTVPR